MTKPTVTTRCSVCGNPLPPNHAGPCPICGKKGKVHYVTLKATEKVVASISWKSTHEFYEKNPTAYWIVVFLTIVSPVIGYFVIGLAGIVVGVILGVLSYYIGQKAVTKVREIRQG
jgi:uncharacterized OB-fold protein